MIRELVLDAIVVGKTEPGGSKRGFTHRYTGRALLTDANPRAARWKENVTREVARVWDREPLTDPVECEMCFYTPRPQSHYGSGRNSKRVKPSAPEYPGTRPDVLKLARSVEDALTQAGVWRDDALIVTERLAKRFGTPQRVELRVYRLPSHSESVVEFDSPLAVVK